MTPELEHHDPRGRSDYLSAQHVHRYRFAAERIAPGSRVLDVACGVGYGSGMLSEAGLDVVGLDCDRKLVERAGVAWPAVQFVHGDALELPFDDETFDAVVSFETIEHVTDAEAFLGQLRRVLRPGGLLLCSTPNIRYTFHPAFHLKEYRPEEFFTLVEGTFGAVERCGQYFRRRDRLRDRLMHQAWQPTADALDLAGLKQPLAALRNKARRAPARATGQAPPGRNEAPDDRYRVQPYRGAAMIRIMVAVARRKGDG